jgi:hypothetical protein
MGGAARANLNWTQAMKTARLIDSQAIQVGDEVSLCTPAHPDGEWYEVIARLPCGDLRVRGYKDFPVRLSGQYVVRR